jgi:hypothetical protein
MEDAAVHRMAVALSHHTVCQVTIEELQVAADLIRKTSRQMQVISNAPSLFVENLECAKHHLHLLLQELSLLSKALTQEVEDSQKALLCFLIRVKDRAHHQKSTMNYELVFKMSGRHLQP